MTRKEALKLVGHTVAWESMDARIDTSTSILEAVKAQGICAISYRIGYGSDRYTTYQHVSTLFILI